MAGEITNDTTEERRWTTVDNQLRGLYQMVGNGVVSGWAITKASGGLSIVVGVGKGVVSLVPVETTVPVVVSGLPASAELYIFASLYPESYWTGGVAFTASMSQSAPTGTLLIGRVVTGETSVAAVDESVKRRVGMLSSIEDVVASHRHVGGEGNPDLVDLSSDVQGRLAQANMPQEIDASLVATGKVLPARVPKISHVTGLTTQGTLTHAQLDSVAGVLSNPDRRLMGETALTNLLQLVLALKHQWPEIDEYLVNAVAFIPGISPDSQIDAGNTTANVDTRTYAEGGEHRIYGTAAGATETLTKSWDSAAEFAAAEVDGVVADLDRVVLEPTERSVVVDDFEGVGDWTTRISDLSTTSGFFDLDGSTKVQGSYSGSFGSGTQNASNLAFTMSRAMSPQDWSAFDALVFYLKADTLEHGKIYFYLKDASYGTQGSFALCLERNAPTINRDTLTEGWREVVVDISSYQRASVSEVGFFTSTNDGWNPSRSMALHVDHMTLTSGNRFVEDGYARLSYDAGHPVDFWRVRWDSLEPTGTSIKVRVRLANDPSELDPSAPGAPWSAYETASGFEIEKPAGQLHRYIQVEALLSSSPSRLSSPEILRLHVDHRAVAEESEFSYASQDAWESGAGFGLDTASNPGSLMVADVDRHDNVFHGAARGAAELDGAALSTLFSWTGHGLPRTTRQALGLTRPGLGQISAARRGDGGGVWLVDTDNDRVVNIDRAGGLVFGMYGSHLSDPRDVYGGESSDNRSSSSSGSDSEKAPAVLHAVYNPRLGRLNVVFDSVLEPIHDSGTTFDRTKIFMRLGSRRVYFGAGTSFSLLGVDGDKYDAWKGVDNPYSGQFAFESHVLVADLCQADRVAMNAAVAVSNPSLTVSSPWPNQRLTSSVVSARVETPNFAVGTESEDDNKIRWSLDGGQHSLSSSRSVSLGALDDGVHSFEAWLVDGSDNPVAGDGCHAVVHFLVDAAGTSVTPRVEITSPKPAQASTTDPVLVAFAVYNHAVGETGGYLQYSVDGGSWSGLRSTEPLALSGLSPGERTVSIRTVDEWGVPSLEGTATATTSFVVGVGGTANIDVCVSAGAISGPARTAPSQCSESTTRVDAADIVMCNMFSPIDVQVILADTSAINPSGGPTVLVAKLRSPSSLQALAARQGTSPESIFGTRYLDGHSVVQYDMGGNVLFTNNAAKFAEGREDAKSSLGSAVKVGASSLAIADACNRRAIVVATDLATMESRVEWEYDSDRIVSDMQPCESPDREVVVGESSCSPEDVYVGAGATVVWRNSSSVPIRVLSGATTPEAFAADPDLSLYGDEFSSDEVPPGGEVAIPFPNQGDFAWFAHPNVVSGVVHVGAAAVAEDSRYVVLEKEESGSFVGSRVAMLDSWGNVLWTFGHGLLSDPTDVRPLADGAMMVSV